MSKAMVKVIDGLERIRQLRDQEVRAFVAAQDDEKFELFMQEVMESVIGSATMYLAHYQTAVSGRGASVDMPEVSFEMIQHMRADFENLTGIKMRPSEICRVVEARKGGE